MKDAPITEIMTRQVQHLIPNDDMLTAKQMMSEHKIHHLPVLNDGQLMGVISSNDIANIAYLGKFLSDKIENETVFKSLSIHEVMVKDVYFLTSDAMISEAILIFSNAAFHCLPIIDAGQLVGIVTAKDVFRYLTLD